MIEINHYIIEKIPDELLQHNCVLFCKRLTLNNIVCTHGYINLSDRNMNKLKLLYKEDTSELTTPQLVRWTISTFDKIKKNHYIGNSLFLMTIDDFMKYSEINMRSQILYDIAQKHLKGINHYKSNDKVNDYIRKNRKFNDTR